MYLVKPILEVIQEADDQLRRGVSGIIAMVRASDHYNDRAYNWETGEFEDCPPVYELGMSDVWDKEDEIDVLHELGKEDW